MCEAVTPRLLHLMVLARSVNHLARHWWSCGSRRRTGHHCAHKLIDDLEQVKDPHNGTTC